MRASRRRIAQAPAGDAPRTNAVRRLTFQQRWRRVIEWLVKRHVSESRSLSNLDCKEDSDLSDNSTGNSRVAHYSPVRNHRYPRTSPHLRIRACPMESQLVPASGFAVSIPEELVEPSPWSDCELIASLGARCIFRSRE